ncbi:MAG: lysylphosphatidylglycerol synthase domain-containing protein [bacterium]
MPRVVRGIAFVLVLGVFAVVAHSVRRDGLAALDAWRSAHIRWDWFVGAIAAGFLGHALYIVGWRRLLRDSGIAATFWPLARIFLVSNLGRYLPGGKVWQMGIVGVMAAEVGMPGAIVAGSSLLQGIIGVGVGVIVLFVTGGATIGLPMPWLALPVAGVVALLLAPALLRAMPSVREVAAKRVHGIETLTAATMWTLLWTSAASWVLWGVALYALACSVLPQPVASVSAYVAAWCASFLAGIVAIVSPAGLGAREGAMQGVLQNAGMQAGQALVVVVVARVWITLLDVVPAVMVLAWRQWGKGGATKVADVA